MIISSINSFNRNPEDASSYAGKVIVVLYNNHEVRNGHKIVSSAEEAFEYLREKEIEEIVVCGVVQIFNAFLNEDLVTDIYLNIAPILVGDVGVIGSKDDLFFRFDKLNCEPVIENRIRLHLSN